MKIAHTADIHLHSDHPQRLAALEQIVKLATERQADLLLIAGDLFDDNHQAQLLRPQLRTLFSNLPFSIVAIPGNHDQKAYEPGSYYGQNFYPLNKHPYAIYEHRHCRVVGVPYFDGSLAPLIPQLRREVKPDALNLLLLHCTWALPHFTDQDYGGEGQGRYLPVTADLLNNLGYDYILAGHFHATYTVQELPCGTKFIYSGSPVSVTAREQGRRGINWLENGRHNMLVLDSYYHQTLTYNLTGKEWQQVLNQLEQDLDHHPDHLCQLLIEMTGFCSEDETQIQRLLDQLVAGRTNTRVNHACRSVRKIQADSLYQRVEQKLAAADIDESMRRLARDLLLAAFIRQAAEG